MVPFRRGLLVNDSSSPDGSSSFGVLAGGRDEATAVLVRDYPLVNGGLKDPNQYHMSKNNPIPLGGVLDCFYTSEEAWIFNPPFLKPLD